MTVLKYKCNYRILDGTVPAWGLLGWYGVPSWAWQCCRRLGPIIKLEPNKPGFWFVFICLRFVLEKNLLMQYTVYCLINRYCPVVSWIVCFFGLNMESRSLAPYGASLCFQFHFN